MRPCRGSEHLTRRTSVSGGSAHSSLVAHGVHTMCIDTRVWHVETGLTMNQGRLLGSGQPYRAYLPVNPASRRAPAKAARSGRGRAMGRDAYPCLSTHCRPSASPKSIASSCAANGATSGRIERLLAGSPALWVGGDEHHYGEASVVQGGGLGIDDIAALGPIRRRVLQMASRKHGKPSRK